MFENWSNVQQERLLNGEVVSNLICDLKSEETCVFYLRAQNCCFSINRKKGPASYTLSCFQSSASNKQVMSVDSDLLCIYPTFELCVENIDILCSNSFANQLAELANTEITQATSKKKGVDNIECRDVIEPKLVFEWISSILVANHSSVVVKDGTKVVKKLRDDIIHSNKLSPFRRSGLWMSIKVVLQIRLCEIYIDMPRNVSAVPLELNLERSSHDKVESIDVSYY